MSDTGAWLIVRELVVLLKQQGTIDDAFIERLIRRVEHVVDNTPDLPEVQLTDVRLSISELRAEITDEAPEEAGGG